jgi:hypothetical protein
MCDGCRDSFTSNDPFILMDAMEALHEVVISLEQAEDYRRGRLGLQVRVAVNKARQIVDRRNSGKVLADSTGD